MSYLNLIYRNKADVDYGNHGRGEPGSGHGPGLDHQVHGHAQGRTKRRRTPGPAASPWIQAARCTSRCVLMQHQTPDGLCSRAEAVFLCTCIASHFLRCILIKPDRIARIRFVLCCLPFASAVSARPASRLTGRRPRPSAMQAVAVTRRIHRAATIEKQLEVTVCSDSLIHVTARPIGRPGFAQRFSRGCFRDGRVCPGAAFQFSQSNGVGYAHHGAARLFRFRSATATSPSKPFRAKPWCGKGPICRAPICRLTRQGSSISKTASGPDATEALYGLGQHQSGMFNYRGSVVELGQNNTDVAIPLLVSSKGYAILWNTASFSYVDNRFPLELNLESMAAPADRLLRPLRPADGQHRPPIPLHDRPRAALSRVGLRSLPIQGPLQDAGRDSVDRRRVSRRGIFPWTRSCRTGSGGSKAAKATRSSTPATPTFPPS